MGTLTCFEQDTVLFEREVQMIISGGCDSENALPSVGVVGCLVGYSGVQAERYGCAGWGAFICWKSRRDWG